MNIGIDIDDTLTNSFDYFQPYVAEYFNVGMDYLKENKVSYNKIFSERPTLNDVFLELTGKGLRDAIWF